MSSNTNDILNCLNQLRSQGTSNDGLRSFASNPGKPEQNAPRGILSNPSFTANQLQALLNRSQGSSVAFAQPQQQQQSLSSFLQAESNGNGSCAQSPMRLNKDNLHEALSTLMVKRRLSDLQEDVKAPIASARPQVQTACSMMSASPVAPPAPGQSSNLQQLLWQIVQTNDSNLQQQPQVSQESSFTSSLFDQLRSKTANASPAPPAASVAGGADVESLLADFLNAVEQQKQEEKRAQDLRNQTAAAALLQEQQQRKAAAQPKNGNKDLVELLELLQQAKGTQVPPTPQPPREDPTKALLAAFLSQQQKEAPASSSTNNVATVSPVPMMEDSKPSAIPMQQESPAPQPAAAASEKKRRRGRSGSFPQKIHQMLRDLEQQGREDIASFVQDGKAFCIHRPKEFASEVMPKYFKMGSYASFQRQLNLYNFSRISEGPHRGSYWHELFVSGKPLLSTTMKRKEVKKLPSKQQAGQKESPAMAMTDQ